MIQADIGILGAGAVGHMLAFFLGYKAKLPVQLWGAGGPLLKSKLVTFAGEEIEIAGSSPASMPRLWFCCLKAHTLEIGLRQHLAKLPVGSTLIILSNGYLDSILTPIALEFKAIVFRKGIVTRGVKESVADGYCISEQGQVIWGGDYTATQGETEILLRLAPWGFQWNRESCRLRREKWFYNTCLNTLCGIHRLPSNGDAILHYKAELAGVAAEVFRLSAELWPHWEANEHELWDNLLQLIADTSQNENSMAADVRLGRPTEGMVLSGLVHEARDPSCYPMLLAWDLQLKR